MPRAVFGAMIGVSDRPAVWNDIVIFPIYHGPICATNIEFGGERRKFSRGPGEYTDEWYHGGRGQRMEHSDRRTHPRKLRHISSDGEISNELCLLNQHVKIEDTTSVILILL